MSRPGLCESDNVKRMKTLNMISLIGATILHYILGATYLNHSWSNAALETLKTKDCPENTNSPSPLSLPSVTICSL